MATEIAACDLLAGCALPPREARALLAHVLGTTREALVARPQWAVQRSAAAAFERLAQRRRGAQPDEARPQQGQDQHHRGRRDRDAHGEAPARQAHVSGAASR